MSERLRQALEKIRPTESKEEQGESVAVKLARLKLEQGEPLSAKDKLALGWQEIHSSQREENTHGK